MADAAARMLSQGGHVPFGAVDGNRVLRSLSAFLNRRPRRVLKPRGVARIRTQRVFYVLESVHQGCPVYTNGVGNNRHLLPTEHGINVYETFDMVKDDGGRGPRWLGAGWRKKYYGI